MRNDNKGSNQKKMIKERKDGNPDERRKCEIRMGRK